MANQFTKGTRTKHDDATKDKIRAELLSKRLEKYAKARGKGIVKHHMEPAQVAAAKVLIERGKPALQSVEQIIVNPMDQMSPEEIYQQAKALITSEIALLLRVLDEDPALRASVQAHLSQKPVLVQHKQDTQAA